MGPFPAGTRYSALDPELLLWVHATLVDSALLVHSQWVGPLSEARAGGLLRGHEDAARALFGTPPDVIPATLGDFRLYMEEMLASDAARRHATRRGRSRAPSCTRRCRCRFARRWRW